MTENNERKLRVLERIDDELIEVHTRRRARLFGRRRSIFRSWAFRGSAAAVACILLALILLPIFTGKQVPIYRGMSVLDELPSENKETVSLMSMESGELVAAAADGYFRAKPGEDIYINVELSNPDDFEILSFTLNGTKYTSYMFESGSDLENIIVKCNVGNTEGLVHYTISEMKYVDGTEIKDVKMEGKRTISVMVSESGRPLGEISNTEGGFDYISYTATVSDPASMIGAVNGKVYASLYDEDNSTLIERREISLSEEAEIKFEKLEFDTGYYVRISAEYDRYNGQGVKEYTVRSCQIHTKSPVILNVGSERYDSAVFSFAWDESYDYRVLESLGLYTDGYKVRELTPSDTELEGLLANTEYTVIARFYFNDKLSSVETSFTTEKYTAPIINIDTKVYFDRVSYSLRVSDNHNLLKSIERITLTMGGEEIEVVDAVTEGAFDGLSPLAEYCIRVDYKYDARDGKGDVSTYSDVRFVTQSAGLEVKDGKVTGRGSCTDSVLYIGMPIARGAFSNDTDLTEVYLGNCGEVGEGAFNGCTSLSKVRVSGTLMTLGKNVFLECTSLEDISLPSSLVTIGVDAFKNCVSLRSFTVPKRANVTSVRIFEGCIALEEFVLREDNDNYSVIDGNLYSKDGEKLLLYAGGRSDSDFTVPDGVTSISSFAFNNCRNLTGTVTFSESVTKIESSAYLAVAKVAARIVFSDTEGWSCGGLTLDVSVPENNKYLPIDESPNGSPLIKKSN